MMSVGLNTPPSWRRRNSISSIIHIKLDLPTTTRSSFPNTSRHFPSLDFELASLGPPSSYTSLKDLLPTYPGVQSPTTSRTCPEITIRNRLVKHAAWAYLQPMTPSPDYSAGHHFLRRIWVKYSSDYLRIPVTGFFCFFRHRVFPSIRSALSRLLGVFSFGIGRCSCWRPQ